LELFLFPRRDRRPSRHNGEHDAETDSDQCANREPDTGDVAEDARLPQRQAGTCEKNEVTDEIDAQKVLGGTWR
jgi:hypothetical protein